MSDRVLDDLLMLYSFARREVEEAQKHLDGMTKALTAELERRGQKTARTSADGYLLQATYTTSTQVRVDEPGLRKKLGAKTFDSYTKRVLDRRRLEQAIETGEIPAVAVQPFVTTKVSDPFIRFTMKEDKAEDDGQVPD